MANERWTDLPCREKCPFYYGRLDRGLRPCITKVQEGEQNCIEQIGRHYSPSNPGAVAFEFLPKKIEVSVDGKPTGTVFNGVAVFFKTQP